MDFRENISLQKYADTANQKFRETENSLSQIVGVFETRMNGKSKSGIIGSMVATFCWTVVVCVFFGVIKNYVSGVLYLVALGISLTLLGTLFIDEVISFSYYGKIFSYSDNIDRLKSRVCIGRSSIRANQDAFMKSHSNGWWHPFSVATSIPEEISMIESTIQGMESLKGGVIDGLKNFLFFSFAIAITIVGSCALFGTAGEIITGITREPFDNDSIHTFCIIGLLLTLVGEIILAKLVWSKTDCAVTNTTLFIAAAGPLAYLALIAIATLLVIFVIWAVSIVIAIAVAALVFGLLCSYMSGG